MPDRIKTLVAVFHGPKDSARRICHKSSEVRLRISTAAKSGLLRVEKIRKGFLNDVGRQLQVNASPTAKSPSHREQQPAKALIDHPPRYSMPALRKQQQRAVIDSMLKVHGTS
jgi:hypothetical protein